MARQQDDQAAKVLKQIADNHPRFELPQRWLQTLSQERLGRIAVKSLDPNGSVHVGFWLDRQLDVRIRTGAAEEASHFEARAELYQTLQIPGIVPFAVSGVAPDGRPYLATKTQGIPAAKRYQKRLAVLMVADHLEEGLRLLWSLGELGVSVASFDLQACCVDVRERLWMEDLSQCTRSTPEIAGEQNLRAAKQWCEAQLAHIGFKRRPLFALDALAEAADFDALIQWSRGLT